MNRNRVREGGQEQGQSTRRPDTEVVYVGRASFWTEHSNQLFQEMPESPWPVAREAEAGAPAAGKAVPVQAAPATAGASVILGINLSGPIILQQAPVEVPGHRDDLNGTLPAGEVSFPHVGRRTRGSLPSTFTALMIVTVVAFSAGLLVSPLGDAPAPRHAAAPQAVASHEIAAPIEPSPAPQAVEAARIAPLIVPTAVAVTPRAKAPVGRGAKASVSANSERVQWTQAPKNAGSRSERRRFAAGSVHARSLATARLESEAAADERLPSRKSAEKESLDLTKHGDNHEKPVSKPWVDPWAD